MNQVTHESKDTLTKTLAIIGFLAVIVLIVWVVVQAVRFIPNATTSLASIADSVYGGTPTLDAAPTEDAVAVGEPLTVAFGADNRPGIYTFSYECTEGVTLSIETDSTDSTAAACEEIHTIGRNPETITISASSEDSRFVDVQYVIGYSDAAPIPTELSSNGVITVVNTEIPVSETVAGISTTAAAEAQIDNEAASVSEPETAPAPVVATPLPPVVVEEPVFVTPVSDPNGSVDLATRFLGVGELNGNTFSFRGEIEQTDEGSFQFAVKNIGTKTSEDWTFTATLPSGAQFVSNTQAPLKPNEEAVLTLGFTAIGETGVRSFGANIDTDGDVNTANNSFSWAVTVVE